MAWAQATPTIPQRAPHTRAGTRMNSSRVASRARTPVRPSALYTSPALTPIEVTSEKTAITRSTGTASLHCGPNTVSTIGSAVMNIPMHIGTITVCV